MKYSIFLSAIVSFPILLIGMKAEQPLSDLVKIQQRIEELRKEAICILSKLNYRSTFHNHFSLEYTEEKMKLEAQLSSCDKEILKLKSLKAMSKKKFAIKTDLTVVKKKLAEEASNSDNNDLTPREKNLREKVYQMALEEASDELKNLNLNTNT